MTIHYNFRFQDGRDIAFKVNSEYTRPAANLPAANLPAWTRLGHCRCPNCPLDPGARDHCPAATAILPVVEAFSAEDAYQRVSVTVVDDRRSYNKETALEEALRSLLGLKMATSGCPLLSRLKPMTLHHLPFANSDEFVLRSVSYYLLQQLFVKRTNGEPDWELGGLVELNKSLQLVNQALWQRIHAVCRGDSTLKALLNFFSMASSVSVSLESQLRKLQSKMVEEV